MELNKENVPTGEKRKPECPSPLLSPQQSGFRRKLSLSKKKSKQTNSATSSPVLLTSFRLTTASSDNSISTRPVSEKDLVKTTVVASSAADHSEYKPISDSDRTPSNHASATHQPNSSSEPNCEAEDVDVVKSQNATALARGELIVRRTPVMRMLSVC